LKLVFLHGRAAVGKLTIARLIAEQTGYGLFHNHLIVDAVLGAFPFGSDPFIRLRDEFWLRTFEEAAREDRSLVFTFAPEPSVPDSFVDETIARIGRHGGTVHFVGLTCSPEEQERRIENPDRKQFRKLASLATLHDINTSGRRLGRIPPSDLSIDTTRLPAPAAAAQIIGHFSLAKAPPPARA
jgi:chloramphenicol 3-O-phosphotransferase